MKPTKKIAIVVTNHTRMGKTGEKTGWHCSEVSHPVAVFREAGFEVTFVSPEGGKTEPDPSTTDTDDDAHNAALLESSSDLEALHNTVHPSTIDPQDYAAIFLAGGHGTMWDFPESRPLQSLIKNMAEAGRIIAGVCHGPAALVNVKFSDGRYLIEGKDFACFTNQEEKLVQRDTVVPFLLASKLESRGGRHYSGDPFEKQVIVSGKLVTGQNPASAQGVAEEVVFQIKHSDDAQRLMGAA
jgi:putative intracellular protease/amidase